MDENDPEEICMQKAFQALLKGDYAERDRLVKEIEKIQKQKHMDAKTEAVQKALSVDYYVSKDGIVYSSKTLYAAAN